MKKLLVSFLALVMLLSMAACTVETDQGGKNNGTDNNGESNSQGGKNDGTGENESEALDMEAVYEKLAEAAELPEMLPLGAGMILNLCGVAEEDAVQAKVVICANSLRTDEIWLMEAKDADAAARIVEAANNRLETKGAESITYDPEQYAVVQKAELLQKGNYIALIVSPDVDALAEAFRQEAGL